MNTAEIFNDIYWSVFVIITILIFICFLKYKREFDKNLNLSKSRLTIFLDFIEFVPNFYISLGIFGTFLGITVGLNDLNFDSLENLNNNISELLKSMNLAFISSLFGIIFSLLFKIIILSRFNNKVLERLDKIEIEENQELIFAINNVKNEISNLGQSSFSQVANTLNNEVSNYVQSIQSNTATVIDNFISKFDKINSILENSIKSIDDSLTFIRQYKDSVEENQRKLHTQFEEISQISENIKIINSNLESSLKVQLGILEKEGNNIEMFYSKMENTTNCILKLNEVASKSLNMLEQSSKDINNLPEKIDKFFVKTTSIINEYPLTLKKNLNTSFSELDEHISNVVGNFRKISELVNNSISGFQESIKNLNDIQKKLQININNISESQKFREIS